MLCHAERCNAPMPCCAILCMRCNYAMRCDMMIYDAMLCHACDVLQFAICYAMPCDVECDMRVRHATCFPKMLPYRVPFQTRTFFSLLRIILARRIRVLPEKYVYQTLHGILANVWVSERQRIALLISRERTFL